MPTIRLLSIHSTFKKFIFKIVRPPLNSMLHYISFCVRNGNAFVWERMCENVLEFRIKKVFFFERCSRMVSQLWIQSPSVALSLISFHFAIQLMLFNSLNELESIINQAVPHAQLFSNEKKKMSSVERIDQWMYI